MPVGERLQGLLAGSDKLDAVDPSSFIKAVAKVSSEISPFRIRSTLSPSRG